MLGESQKMLSVCSVKYLVFYQPININITTCDDLIWVACCLHNMLRDGYMENNKRPFYELDSEQTEPTNNMLSMTRGGGFYNIEGFEVRDRFKHFFNNEGSVSWQ